MWSFWLICLQTALQMEGSDVGCYFEEYDPVHHICPGNFIAKMDDKEVTWMPAYGPEQRGGTANVTVIVSDEKISSPILSKFDIAIVLNQPSLEKFEPKLKPGGILIYDGYGILNPPTRKDITVYRIDAMDKAAEMKNSKVFNMIVLGGLLKVAPVVSTKGVEKALFKTLPERHHEMIPLNMQAIEEGGKIIEQV